MPKDGRSGLCKKWETSRFLDIDGDVDAKLRVGLFNLKFFLISLVNCWH
jgi:hypothetical protein